ncbi:MAG: hypothetical protein R2877_05835 [Bdellovibrionota bacterium]
MLIDNEWKKSFQQGNDSEIIERFKEAMVQKCSLQFHPFSQNDDEKSMEEKVVLIEKIFDLESE